MAIDGPSPARRDVLRGAALAAAGISATMLPTASAAASTAPAATTQLSPTIVDAQPIGYGSTDTTGAIELSWTAVVGATSYSVYGRTGDDAYSLWSTPLTTLSTRVSGLEAGETYEAYVVAASSDPTVLSSQSETVTSNASVAVGGTIAAYTDGASTYVVHVFTHLAETAVDGSTPHTFTLHRSRDVDHLVVAGGGGGGGDVGGGGGAGGLLTSLTTTRGTGTGPVARAVGDHAVLVGGGGAGGAASSGNDGIGSDGALSSAFGSVVATGGGGGGTYGGATAGTEPGRTGGSGGGGGGGGPVGSMPGGTGTAGQGSAGGAGAVNTFAGGAGGGAAAVGTSGAADAVAAGGSGLAVGIVPASVATTLGIGEVSGTTVNFAGGGGAGSQWGDGPGGLGGGGLGRLRGGIGDQAAMARTGGGGGAPGGIYGGGAGGTGIVVLRYLLPA